MDVVGPCVLYREGFLLCPSFGVSFIGGSITCYVVEKFPWHVYSES